MGLELRYFVLKPNGTSIHARASREALRAYAATLRKLNRADTELAHDLEAWADFGDEEVARVQQTRGQHGKPESQGNNQGQQAFQGEESSPSRSRRWAEGGPDGVCGPQSPGFKQEAESGATGEGARSQDSAFGQQSKGG